MAIFAWRVHHEVLLEPLTEPIEVRQEYIREQKPEHERELRLRLLKPVTGALPAAVVEASKAYMPDILALHAAECPDCPWDGKTIFP